MSMKNFLLVALTMLAALAIPASASATWTHEEEATNSEESATLSATGTAQFNTFLGGVHCPDATASFVVQGGSSTGKVESFKAGAGCVGSGSLEGCTVAETQLTDEEGEPAEPVLHENGTDVVVTDVRLWALYEQDPEVGTECGIEESQLDFTGEDVITIEVDPNTNEIESLTLSAPSEQGGILTAFDLSIPGVSVQGNLTIEEHCTWVHSGGLTTLENGCRGTFGF